MKSLAILLALLVAGCASIKIEVGVLNPKVVSDLEEADRLDRVMPSLVTEHETSIAARFAAVSNEHYKAYSDVEKAYRDEANKLPAGSAARVALEVAADSHLEFPPTIEKIYTDSESQLKVNTGALQGLWKSYKEAATDEARAQFRDRILWLLDERDGVLKVFAATVQTDLREVTRNLEADVKLPLAERLRVLGLLQTRVGPGTAKALTKLFDSGGLENSPYAYYVASAPDELWAGKYDKTFAWGLFGNTDIAIKALGPTNFTLKGLSFNPADVAATASKVATQTVLLASQIAGVPVKISGTPAQNQSGTALATSSGNLSTLLVANTQTSESVRNQRESLLRIAAAIVGEKDSISGASDARRREALNAITAVYESNAPRLRVGATTEGK